MVILHVVAPAEIGGLERVVQALAIGHQTRGHQVSLVAVLDEEARDHPFLAPLRQAGIQVFPLALPPRRYHRERAFVAGLCRRLRPDVVHTHGYRCDVIDAGPARGMGIATVTTVHGFTGGGPKNRLYEWLQFRAFRRFDVVVAVSKPQVEQLAGSGVSRERIHLLPNAWGGASGSMDRVEALRQLEVPDGRFHVGWVGRLSREKGLDVLLDALAHLEGFPLRVSVLGDGRERQALEARVAASGMNDRVRFHGSVSDAGRLFSAFDVFVEAIAAGTPIVATRVGGVPDVVSDREASLVPPDDAAALAVAIRAACCDTAAASDRAAAARERLANEFSVEPWLTRYEALYGQVRKPALAEAARA
jgi:glycosyltransferase involved in cell wall biosynthesis